MKKFARTLAVVCLFVCFVVTLSFAAACAQNSDETPAKNAITITFDTDANGVTVPSITAEAGSKINPPADPVRNGYRFEGWELNGQTYTFDTMPQSDITLKAVWSKLYSITFNTNGGTEIPSVQYAQGDTISLPDSTTLSGFKFDGWELNGTAFTQTVMPAENLTLTAKWKQAYTITFNTGVSDFTVAPIVEESGAKITAPVVHRQGYYLKNWKLNNTVYKFNVMPAQNITLTAEWEKLTNLPAMVVELSDKNGNAYPLSSVTREKYVDSKITITNTEDKFLLSSLKSSFKGRGNGSWTDSGDKKGYKIKFDKKQSLFGRAANKHWVVIACTNFDDVTMSRNYLAYNMGNQVFTNIEYATQARWIDLYVNNEYRGVYLLCEHVRVGNGRVDIESDYLEDNFENTGYLVEYDAYYSGVEGIDYFKVDGLKYAFTVHSPDPEDCNDETEGGLGTPYYMRQVAYIKDYVTDVYNAALAGNYNKFAELADVDSFVDMYILHELFKNVDAGYSSFYLYKKPNGKLFAGPPWDFDATANGAEGRGDRTPQGIYVADSIQNGRPDAAQCASELYISLYKTNGFKSAVKARWKVLSPTIKNYLNETLNDAVYEEYKAAMGKNFALWKGKSQTAAENDWVYDIKALKQWLLDRISWLDTEWK